MHKLLAAVTVLAVSTAQADTINVGPGDSIQDAIVAAMDGDEIVVSPGTYFETIDLLGKAITLRSSDETAQYMRPGDPAGGKPSFARSASVSPAVW